MVRREIMEMLEAKEDRMVASCSEFSHLVLYRLPHKLEFSIF